MNKYDIKLIMDYVNGNDIDGYDIEELENDYYFMMQVIFYTNDKNMYNLCSKEVKTNFKFIKFIINKFNTDIPFIFKVSKFFLANSDNILEKMELVLMIIDLIKDKKDDYDDEYYDCMMILNRVYRTEKTVIEIAKTDDEIKDILEEYGLGFIFILDKYSGNKRVMDFFAERMIDDILEMDINFEKIVHKRFNSFQELETFGINNFCIDFLRTYDVILADYVSENLTNLDTLKKRLRLIKRNWENYNIINKKHQYSLLCDVIGDYIDKNNSCFYTVGVICCIGKELGVLDDVIDYMLFDDDCYDLEFLIRETEVIKKEHGLVALKEYLEIKKIMLDIISSRDITECEEKYRSVNVNNKSI